MSILDNLPHVCTAKQRRYVRGVGGGQRVLKDGGTLFTDRACWRQVASDAEIIEFEKAGITVTDRFYFTSDPGLDSSYYLTDVRSKGATAGTGDTWEVVSRAEPDASAGLGRVYRVMARKTTTGSTE